jgi:N-acetylglucosamine-6-phosphate deacetylase
MALPLTGQGDGELLFPGQVVTPSNDTLILSQVPGTAPYARRGTERCVVIPITFKWRHWQLKCAILVSGMTLDPAWASFTENILGSITPGKRADYVVLSKDIMTIPESEILHTKVLATAIDGRPIYGHI